MAPIARADQVIRHRVVAIKMADDEIEMIDQAAAAQGVTRSAYLRGTALAEASDVLVANTFGAATS